MPKEPKIIFHHIPKCGGTSIVTGLAATYYPWRLLFRGKKGFSARLNAPQAAKEAENKGFHRFTYRRHLLKEHVMNNTCPFISGHYPFDPSLYEDQKDEWCFITLMRDPLKRWYSEYFWNRYKDHDYAKTDLPMEAYLESDQGKENTRSFVNYFSVTERISDTVLESEKKEALDNLSKLTVIGFLDELGLFKKNMKKVFGRTPFFPQLNKSPAQAEEKIVPDKGSDFEKKLLILLEADIEVYRKAKEGLGL